MKCFIESDASCLNRVAGLDAAMRVGYIIKTARGVTVARVGEYVGPGTINVAEYYGIIHALKLAIKLGFTHAECKTDSQLLAYQVSGTYEAKDIRIKKLLRMVQVLGRLIDITLNWTPREGNEEADALAKTTTYEVNEWPYARLKPGWRTAWRLHDWDVQRIKEWQNHAHYREGMLEMIQRIFDLDLSALRRIQVGDVYKDLPRTDGPDWDNYERPTPDNLDPAPADAPSPIL